MLALSIEIKPNKPIISLLQLLAYFRLFRKQTSADLKSDAGDDHLRLKTVNNTFLNYLHWELFFFYYHMHVLQIIHFLKGTSTKPSLNLYHVFLEEFKWGFKIKC